MLIKFINSIENLAKSSSLRKGDIYKATEEILKESAIVLKCERVNAWTFNETRDQLDSLKSYTSSNKKFQVEVPNYFNYLKKGDIIVSDDAQNAEINKELLDIYINPLSITSMIDIPIRSEGNMIGVVCFEHVNTKHTWTLEEQKFTQSIAQLLSLALESFEKKKYQKKLEKTIHEKEVLISEVNHRVKNNMAVIISLLNIQNHKCKDDYHSNIIKDVTNRVYSMASIQQRLHTSQSFSEINMELFLKDLIINLTKTYATNKKIQLDLDLSPILIDITKAVPCGLIANEVLTNSFKYAFGKENKLPYLKVYCKSNNGKTKILIKDNGPGIESTSKNNDGAGLDLIKDLSLQIDSSIKINSENGVEISWIF